MRAAFGARCQIRLSLDVASHHDHWVVVLLQSQFIACDHAIQHRVVGSGDLCETSTSAVRFGARFNVWPILDVTLDLCGHHERGMAMFFGLQLTPADYAIKRSE